MEVQWHIAFSNVTFTEYAGVTYRDYYQSPENMLAAQLAAKDRAERLYGVGGFITPYIDIPSIAFSAYLGMPLLEPEEDELPYIDGRMPLLRTPEDVTRLKRADLRTTGLMGRRWDAWQYYRSRGYPVRYGGHSGAIVTTAHEISGGDIFLWALENPDSGTRILDFITETDLFIRAFDESLCGVTNAAYTGDDFSGLMSPEMYRTFAIPQYRKIYAGKADRFMHSELLRAEHLRIARDELGITCFHGAACENLTLTELHDIMGHRFWTQLTPQDLLELSPHDIAEKVKRFAHSGCGFVQLYPGRDTPDSHMQAAISAVERECKGGRVGRYLDAEKQDQRA